MTKIGAIAVIAMLILLIIGVAVGILACAVNIPGDEKPHGKVKSSAHGAFGGDICTN